VNQNLFNAHHISEGLVLIHAQNIKSIIFSGGTYQVEIFDPKCKQTLWPFLQLNDKGDIKDSFCSCNDASKEKSCSHLAAAFMQISNKKDPLHVRFHRSFWNKLCLIGFKRHGNNPRIIEQRGEKHYVCTTSCNRVVFSVITKTEKGQEILDEILFHRKVETEETSLKFSNLSTEEFALWKRGTPSHNLQYELSFWSDLAKWMMLIQEFKKWYSIDFIKEQNALPKESVLYFSDLEFRFYIAKINWEEIIPSFATVDAPLLVHELRDIVIHRMEYDPIRKSLDIISENAQEQKKKSGIKIGRWEFYPDTGFFPQQIDPLLKKKTISAKHLGQFLYNNMHLVQRYLKGTLLSLDIVHPSYDLYFDKKKQLHISCFIFEKGDLQRKSTIFFKPWVYIDKQGFYLLKKELFDEIERVIPFDKVEEFIVKNHQWINKHAGFQIHPTNAEFYLSYHFDLETLTFTSTSKMFEGIKEVIDFGHWIYMKGRGFYKKLSLPIGKNISAMRVPCRQIPLFIHKNREDLEHVKNFFNPICPIEKVGLNIFINDEQKIVVEPDYYYKKEYQGKKVYIFDDFTYIPDEGFAQIPSGNLLPKKYRKKVVIDKYAESAFIITELVTLKPFIIKIDHRLKSPSNLTLRLQTMMKTKKKKWKVRLAYASEFGEENFCSIQKGIEKHRSYVITQAGLLFLKDPRFNWIRKMVCATKGSTLTLSTLEWMGLRIYENIIPPSGQSKTAIHTRNLLQELDSFTSDDTLSLRGLKSTLRPYQKLGVKWLWFLYSYGLSGLLCDDMGLGKTHQAMALLAGAKNSNMGKKNAFCVVTPTSVLYHWEELLQKFLPKLRVVVFYGAQRSLKEFNSHADLLLTSYGTLRSDRKILMKTTFTIIIFDEMQVAKNSLSQVHQSLKMLRSKIKIGLTGTPIENCLQELKALFDILLPSYLPSTAQYREIFVNPIEKFGDQGKKHMLSQLIHPFLLRRKKSDVLEDLPEKTEEIAYCSLSKEQQQLYRTTLLKSRDIFAKKLGKKPSIPHIFTLLNRLKQICNHPSLIIKDFSHYKRHQSGKWDLFIELLNEARNSKQKLVVFSQYLGMMTIIERYLCEHGIQYASIRGSTRNRKKQLHIFRDDPNCEVFVASLKAVGTGVDLTAASVVLHFDRWWNPAKEDQATDRIHRIGQTRGVQVFKMVTRGTIECHIHKLIAKKVNLLNNIIEYDDKEQIKQLNRAELMAILEQLNKDMNTYKL